MKKSLIAIIIINIALAINLVIQMNRVDNEGQLQSIVDLYMTGEYADALDYIDYYLADNPDDHVGWTIKGNLLVELDCDEEAEECYLIALEIEPYNFQAINALGVISRREGDYEEAREFYKAALILNPDYAQALTSLAIVELKMGNDAEALSLARAAFEKSPEDPMIVANLAIVSHYNDEIEDRDKYTELARQLNFEEADSLALIYSGKISARD